MNDGQKANTLKLFVTTALLAGMAVLSPGCERGKARPAGEVPTIGDDSNAGSAGEGGVVAGSTGTSTEPPRPSGAGGARGPSGPPPNFGSAVSALRPPAAISGGTLRVLSDGITAIASDPDRDRVFVVNLKTRVLIADVALQPGDEPGRIAEDATGAVHVALRRGGALITLHPGSWAIAGRRPVCGAPRGVAFDPSANLLHVACAGGELVSLPPAPEAAAVRRLRLDRDLRDVVVQGNNLLVSRFRQAEMLVIDPTGDVLRRATPPVRESRRVAQQSPDAKGTQASGPTTFAPAVAWRLLAGPGNEALMLHQRGLTDEIDPQAGGYGGGKCSGIVETGLSRIPVGGTTNAPASGSLSMVTLPVDMALAPDGRRVAMIAAANSKTPGLPQLFISSLDIATSPGDCVFPSDPEGPSTTGTKLDPAGPAPAPPRDAGVADGSTLDDDADPIFPPMQPQGEAVAVAFTPKGHVVVQTREPATLQIVTAGKTIVLSTDSRADTGHAIFHSNSGGGIACASCHPEGAEDGRVWKFAKIGQRRTQSLRAGISATAPFHWDGEFGDMGKLMDEVFVNRMGGPKLDANYVTRLNTWMDSIPALLPVAIQGNADAVARGKALYAGPVAACATCHAGALLTDNKTVDVGTGKALQVPSLRGVAARAPFMHDGCAATLQDRFSNQACGGGDRHGVTSKLTPTQVADLIAYLETL